MRYHATGVKRRELRSQIRYSPCWGPRLEVVIIGESLSTLSVNLHDGNFIRRLVSAVRLLKGAGILAADGSEDLIRLLDGVGLVALCEGTGVEQDEGILFGGDGPKVSRVHGRFEVGDALSVDAARAAPSGGGPGAVGEGHSGEAGEDCGSGGNLSGGGATVHVQGGGGAVDRGRREGGGRGGEGGNEGERELHLDGFGVVLCIGGRAWRKVKVKEQSEILRLQAWEYVCEGVTDRAKIRRDIFTSSTYLYLS